MGHISPISALMKVVDPFKSEARELGIDMTSFVYNPQVSLQLELLRPDIVAERLGLRVIPAIRERFTFIQAYWITCSWVTSIPDGNPRLRAMVSRTSFADVNRRGFAAALTETGNSASLQRAWLVTAEAEFGLIEALYAELVDRILLAANNFEREI